MMNCKEFGRKQSCPVCSTIPVRWRTSVWASGDHAEIRTRHLRDACLEGYRSVPPDMLITTQLVKQPAVLNGTQIFLIAFIKTPPLVTKQIQLNSVHTLENHVKSNTFPLTPRLLKWSLRFLFSSHDFIRMFHTPRPLRTTWFLKHSTV